MVLGARGGGFGTPGMGPFRTGGGDFSRYNIGDDGAQLDAARRDAAVIAWGNGTITDDAYLSALQTYWQRQSKDDPRWLSARDDYEDARYSIGRNRRVRDVNNSASSRERLRALDALIGYDQRHLRTMTARGRNEQARELEDRIADAEAQVRETRYSDQVTRYNNDRATTEQMLAAARRMARDSRGAPDHETWQGRVTEWENRQWDEEYATAQDAYQRTLTASNGNIRAAGDTLIRMLEQRLGRMGQGTPGRTNMERQLRDLKERVVEDVWNRRVADAEIARQGGQLNDSGYISVLHDRVRALPQGSQARKDAQAQLLNDTYALGERRIRERIQLPKGDEDHLDPFEAVPFYQGYLATMSPGTEKYREIQGRITQLRLEGIQPVSLAADPKALDRGHWVLPTGAPDGTAGFTSQFDGSAFATQNCMFASGAMMFDALGGADLSGADLRRYAGDPSGAGFQSDLQRAYEGLGFAVDRHNGMAFNSFMRQLGKSQGGAVVIGLLADLPQQFRLTSGGGAHAIYVTTRQRVVDGQRLTWVMDPLGRAGYDGAWWPDEVLQRFAWSNHRNPISGNSIYGNVVFGKRTGRSNATVSRNPRFQAFDTDRHGRSTVGRGGGTSREEAGEVTDWSKQRKKPDPKGSPLRGEQGVTAFLEAAGRIQGPSLDEGGNDVRGTEEEQRARARELMATYNGDARLMTLAWFGRPVEADTTLWSDSDRFYVNSVSVRVGYKKVPPQGIGTIVAGKPASPDLGPGNATPSDAATAPAVHSGDPFTEYQGETLGNALPAADSIASRVIDELGWPQTPDMERAVAAWMRTESPKDTVQGNNPFGIKTPGAHDLPGQVGVDDEGYAIFGTMEDGVLAATADLERGFPDVVAAGNAGDPGKLLDTIGRSGWREGGYGSALVESYNQTPGSGRLLVGGPSAILDVPSDLGALSGRHSDIEDLFRIDPNDAAQVAWYEANMANAEAAMRSGASKWAFHTPDGRTAMLDFNPEMAAQLVDTRADYYGAAGDFDKAVSTRNRATSMRTDLAMDRLDRVIEDLDRQRDHLLSRGDLRGAVEASLDKMRQVYAFTGTPLGEELDIDAIRGTVPGLETSDYDHLSSIVDSVESDAIVKAVDRDYVHIEKGPGGTIASATADPDTFYVRQRPDGTADVRIYGQADQGEFELVPSFHDTDGDGVTDSESMVPAYTQSTSNVWVPEKGMWVPVAPTMVVAAVVDYAGYRMPAPGFVGREQPVWNAMPEGPTSGIGQGTLLGSGVDAIDAAFEALGGLSDLFVGTYGQPQEQPQEQPSPELGGEAAARLLRQVRVPQDGLVRRAGAVSSIPARQVEVVDPDTGEAQLWVSIDGGQQWVGGPRDRLIDAPPTFVLNQDSGIDIVRNGEGTTLVWASGERQGQPLKPEEMSGDFYARNFHIFGSRPEDNPNPYAPPFQGAQGSFYKVINGAPGGSGSMELHTSQPDLNPEVYKWRELQKLPQVFGQFAAQESGMAKVRREAVERIAPDITGLRTTPGQQAASVARASLGGAASLVIPTAKAGPNVMAALAWWRTGTASSAVANGTARNQANARAVIAAAERARAQQQIARQQAAAVKASASPERFTRTPPPPTPKASPQVPQSPKPRESAFVPRQTPGGSQSSMNQRRQGTVKPQAASQPKPSTSPGPKRV